RPPRFLIQRLPRRLQRLHDHGAHLWSQPPADDDHAVLILIYVQRAAPVPPGGLSHFSEPVYPAPAAHDALDVLGGAGFADGEEPLLGLWRRNTREGATLRVRQLATSESVRQSRECAERARYPDALAGGAQVEPDAPRQPLGARAEIGVPTVAGVEFADEIQEPRGGGVEVSRQLGDLIAKPIEICHELVSRVNVG